MNEQRTGVLAGIAAYVMWGAFPLYWPLLQPAGAFEILAHRIIWSLVVMGGLVVALGRARHVKQLVTTPRSLALLSTAAVAVSINWATYIWGVNHHYVVETSLGYFINPLVTVLMGVLILGERMRPLQWVAIGIGAVAVLVIAVDYGHPPWIALVLAFSFGSYGLLKKKANAGAFESLAVETSVMTPIALAYVVWLTFQGDGHFTSEGPGHTALFILCGVVTAVPLICFGAAATRVPLVLLGLLQYLAPLFQFALGILHFHEDMSAGRWVGFVLVWLALCVFTADGLWTRRRAHNVANYGELT
ncbi:EamA family transporter RarD [Nocardioides sp. Kera G14]|uniref:EamA family transporter RarD n=1 Tax=Nocardioides sp. Kera G14 TaxID=2884264 RepID=UPI001D124565|nr:EamA family transporter RarD [Nocardioides sp. Kera G14]UDY23915.1 EamA family transporter RarD [Nocardioides sp. Kera G14]